MRTRLIAVAATTVTLAGAGTAWAFGTFDGPNNLAVSGLAYSIELVDIAGDNQLDVVAAVDGATPNDNVVVFENQGEAGLAAGVPYPAGNGTESVASGHFNDDSVLDLAVANYDGQNVSVLMGQPGGGFAAPAPIPGVVPSWIVRVADLDRDGNDDIVAGNYVIDPLQLSVYLGNGDGTFENREDYDLGDRPPFALEIGRMNEDKRPDVVMINEDAELGVFLAKKNGALREPIVRNIGAQTGGYDVLDLVDLNGDGKLDVVSSRQHAEQVSTLLGRGDGTLKRHRRFDVEATTGAITTGLLDGDKKIDVAVASEPQTVLFEGKGDGTLKSPRLIGDETPIDWLSIDAGKINGDKGADLVQGGIDNVGVYLNEP